MKSNHQNRIILTRIIVMHYKKNWGFMSSQKTIKTIHLTMHTQ